MAPPVETKINKLIISEVHVAMSSWASLDLEFSIRWSLMLLFKGVYLADFLAAIAFFCILSSQSHDFATKVSGLESTGLQVELGL